MSNHDNDNHSNQLNPNNDSYYQSRGYGGRGDYGDDDDYVSGSWGGPGIPGPYVRPQRSPMQQQADSLAANVRAGVASSMRAPKAGEILCAVVGNMFVTIKLTNESEDRTLKIRVSGCKPDSDVAENLRIEVDRWARTRSWMIEGCVDKTEIVFEE